MQDASHKVQDAGHATKDAAIDFKDNVRRACPSWVAALAGSAHPSPICARSQRNPVKPLIERHTL